MADDMGERTEQPTAKRLEEARNRGNIAKSADLSSAVDLIGGTILLITLGAFLVESLGGVMRRVLEDGWRAGGPDERGLETLMRFIAGRTLATALPFLGSMLLVAWLAQILQTGLVFTLYPLQPKFDRLNPMKGVGRLLGTRSLVKTLTNSVKLVVVCTISTLILRGRIAQLTLLPSLSFLAVVKAILDLVVVLAIWLLAVLLVLGIIDYVYQRWQHNRDMRMTKQQVQDERRAMEGDPQIKGRRIRMAREIAMQRINRHVPDATVIVTNPTHFSVAIRYDGQTMRAPRVVAKGVDFMAMRIRQVANLHNVPIVERPPLARGLYYGVDEGREIPPDFYQAVAEVLAYVYRQDDRLRQSSAVPPAPTPEQEQAVSA